MTEFRILAALALLLLAILAAVAVQAARSELSPPARGCRASGGTWHVPQGSCTWGDR